MSTLPIEVLILPEPEIEFASGQCFEHPATGLELFGPFESKGLERPKRIDYAVIGSAHGISTFREFATSIKTFINTPEGKSPQLWPAFPGIEEALHVSFSAAAPHEEVLNLLAIERAAQLTNDHERVYQVTSLYLEAIAALNKKDARIDAAVCVVPEIVYKNCRPLSRISTGPKSRLRSGEVAMRKSYGDLFGEYDSSHYDFSLDFRRQIKARAMEFRIPIQIVRESTLRTSDDFQLGQRVLTPLADRAWNLSAALYYKSGSKPWKLPSAREGVCYVGIAFKRTDDKSRTACSAAQMFIDDGDGVVFLGEYGPWYSPSSKQCHLSREAASKLLSGVLSTYEEQHGKKLCEVFLHSRSEIDSEEWAGYKDACPEGVKLVGIRVAPDRRGLRAFRTETRPILRGTYWKISDRAAYLWTSGFKPSLGTYDGSDVPEPLRIQIQHGDADIAQVVKDIFGLTKLNYNACKLGESQPVTVHFSDAVGEILVANQGAKVFLPNFKYYV